MPASEEGSLAGILNQSRQAATFWRNTPLGERLGIIARLRRLIAADAMTLALSLGERRPLADTLAAEVLPLAEAARFLQRDAHALLAPRRLGRRGRPAWLAGVTGEIRREPFGVVLVIAPSNYPLFLPGVQVMQALTAGNAACVKPALGCTEPMRYLATLFDRAGLPTGVLTVLDDSVETGRQASRAGFDKIVLTGSAATGVEVLHAAAKTMTPCTMELSGDDPVFVLSGADLDLVSRAVGYGTRLNNGETCIAPKRVYAPAPLAPEVERRLALTCAAAPPVIAVRDANDALERAGSSAYALGAAIFGPAREAAALASRLSAGCVTINDVIVPTADPRLPFGGRRGSGFGVTRGAEGLLEMTVVKSIAIRRGRFRPHLAPAGADDAPFLAGLITLLHGTLRQKFRALATMLRTAPTALRVQKR